MPNPYIDNAQRWIELAEIDYLTHFVKAWIPFNAWYMNMYPTLKRDRVIIDEIKSNPNVFRDRLIALLNGQDNDAIIFKTNISKLHRLLESYYIPNANNRITFQSITVERNPTTSVNDSFRRWVYKVELTYSGNNYSINSLVTDSNGTTQYTFNQSKFDLDVLLNHAQSSSVLTENQRDALGVTYKKINPKKLISLISNTNRSGIPAGDIILISDVDKLTKGLIEIIYRLRNSLFHGELIPNNDNKKVYEPAYNILKTLIQSLN